MDWRPIIRDCHRVMERLGRESEQPFIGENKLTGNSRNDAKTFAGLQSNEKLRIVMVGHFLGHKMRYLH